MTEYINKAEVMQYLYERRYTITMKDVSEMSTIDIPDAGIEFETPREQLAFICGAILEKQKRNGERKEDD